MKICLQEGLLPGQTLAEKLDFAESIGVEGLEIGNRRDKECIPVYEDALKGRKIKFAAICGNPTFNFLNPDRRLREESIAFCKTNLEICGHFKAAGQIVPPIFGGPVLPDLSPLFDPISLEYNLMAEILKELAGFAASQGTLLLLEPLNRYEQHFLRKQSDGIRLIKQAGSPAGVALLSDFFHMHIEETNIPQALTDAAGYTRHVHMADNTRLEPGTGDIDFKTALGALKKTGFSGYLSWECGLSGDRAESLTKSVKYIREIIDSLS